MWAQKTLIGAMKKNSTPYASKKSPQTLSTRVYKFAGICGYIGLYTRSKMKPGFQIAAGAYSYR